MNSETPAVSIDDTTRWHREARAGVLLLGCAVAAVPLLQQMANVLFLAGLPRQLGPVSATAIVVMAAFVLGSAGLMKLGKTPLPASRWMQVFMCIAIGVVVVGNKVLHTPIVQGLTLLTMLGAVIIYLMQVDRHVRPEASRLLWWLPIMFLAAIGAVIVAQRFVDGETTTMLIGTAGLLSVVNVPLILVPVMGLRTALRD